MHQFQRNNLHQDAKHLIKKLPVPPFEHSLSSFTSSRNQLSKVIHRTLDEYPDQQDMSIFPSNNDPSIIIVDGHSIIDMSKKSKQDGKQKLIDELAYQNNQLNNRIAQLEEKLQEYQRRQGQVKESSDTKGNSQLKRLKAQLIEKDKKNIQLFNINKQLVEELKMARQQNQIKSKQLNSKSIELKKEKEKLESLTKNKQHQQRNKMDYKAEQLIQQLARRQQQLRSIKGQNQQLLNNIQYLNQELKTAKEHYLMEMRQQTNRYKFQTSELLDKLKYHQSNQLQSASRSTSVRSSSVSNSSLSESFSAQMLSPEQTVELIFNVLRKIAKSEMMQKILYANSAFVNLIGEFAEKRGIRKSN